MNKDKQVINDASKDDKGNDKGAQMEGKKIVEHMKFDKIPGVKIIANIL